MVKFVVDGQMYKKKPKLIYEFMQTILLTNKLLVKHPNVHIFCPVHLIPSWKRHEIHPIRFALRLENFGVEYEKKWTPSIL